MKSLTIASLILVILISGSDVSGQTPTLVINEIMPNPPAGECPWIEICNLSNDVASGNDLVLQTGPTRRTTLPAVSLERGGDPHSCAVVLLRPTRPAPGDPLGRIPDGADCGPTSPGVRVLGTRPDLFGTESPVAGEIVLAQVTATGQDPIDYVAWGSLGSQWSISTRRSLGREDTFVPIDDPTNRVSGIATIPEGWSIGRYPGGVIGDPNSWFLFDADEIRTTHSFGHDNPVPRIKTLTTEDSVTYGSKSLNVVWLPRKYDEIYSVEIATDRRFDDKVISLSTVWHAVRTAEDLLPATYFARVFARSGGRSSLASRTIELKVLRTLCDWPLPPPTEEFDKFLAFLIWMSSPTCGASLDCNMISSMDFKFQRKDSPLRCCKKNLGCSRETGVRCRHNGEHPHCAVVAFSSKLERFRLCANELFSSTCSTKPPKENILSLILQDSPPQPADTFVTVHQSSRFGSRECDHGDDYCALASVAMVVSGFGTCMSQDRIAFERCGHNPNSTGGQLCHGTAMNNADLSAMLTWALQIPEGRLETNPDPAGGNFAAPLQPRWVAAYYDSSNQHTIDYDDLRLWIDARRPIIGRSGNHYRVVTGYCSDHQSRDWVYVFDPRSGPYVELAKSWLKNTIIPPQGYSKGRGLWVAPSIQTWSFQSPLEDPIWNDSDNDGVVDFDEYRFGSDPEDSSSTKGCPTP